MKKLMEHISRGEGRWLRKSAGDKWEPLGAWKDWLVNVRNSESQTNSCPLMLDLVVQGECSGHLVTEALFLCHQILQTPSTRLSLGSTGPCPGKIKMPGKCNPGLRREQRWITLKLIHKDKSGIKCQAWVLGGGRETRAGDPPRHCFPWVTRAIFPHRVRPRGEDLCPQLTPWVAKVCVPWWGSNQGLTI